MPSVPLRTQPRLFGFLAAIAARCAMPGVRDTPNTESGYQRQYIEIEEKLFAIAR